jgi:adenosylcobinamide-phosphate synthase
VTVLPRSLSTAAGLLADRYLGEPPLDPHPVAAFGSLLASLERAVYDDSRSAGMVHAGLGIGAGVVAGTVIGSPAIATFVAVAGRALGDAALEVAEALALDDIDAARALLPALVGRDPSRLDEHEIVRAAVESVAENTTDAVVAPALWSLFAGAPGALGYRATNTLDSMVGHHSSRYEHFGWASARADDMANWIPARVTAALVMLARPRRAAAVWQAVRDDAPAHPSPNAGVAEAAFAAALGLKLGGINTYGDRVEVRARLGSGRDAEPGDIAAAVRLLDDVQVLLALALLTAGAARSMAGLARVGWRAGRRRRSRR